MFSIGREEAEAVASGPFSLGPSAERSRGRAFAAPSGKISFSQDVNKTLATDDGLDMTEVYGFNTDPMAPMAVPSKVTMDAWEKVQEASKMKKKGKKPENSEERFKDANGDVKGKCGKQNQIDAIFQES
jgi:hypothetical protein